MNPSIRLAAAAAILVAVVGVGAFAISRGPDIGQQPTPKPTATATANPSSPVASLPLSLRSRWVGASRVVPEAPEPPYRVGLEISGGDLGVGLSGGGQAFASTAALVAPDTIRLRLAETYALCKVRDEGTYTYTLSPDERTLTLTPIADPCAPRAAALAGDWNRADCASFGGFWCLGDLTAGSHVSSIFNPLKATADWQFQYGSLSYAVPDGWANTEDEGGAFALARQHAPENTNVTMWSDVVPHSQAEMCATVPEPGVGRDAAAFSTWLTTLPGLDTTNPVAVTIGGLNGFMVDMAVAPSWTASCPYAYSAGLPLVSTFAGPTTDENGDGIDWNIQGEGRTRIILLDVGDGRALLVDIEAQNKADYDALLPEAMQVVNSFTFDR